MSKDIRELIKDAIQKVKLMTEEERQAMYREQCKTHDYMAWKSDLDLFKEFKDISDKLNEHQTWGAAVSALLEWKHDLEREIHKRGLTPPAG